MVLAADFYVAAAADFTVTLDQGAPGLDAGDTVTWNGALPVGGLVIGGDAFTTIQAAINAAAPGDTIELAAGTYAENLAVGKPLTIIGAGSGDDPATSTIITAAASGSPTIGYTAGGMDAANRQILRNVRITGARGGTGNNNSGILLSGGSKGFFTFDNVAAVGNTGNGLVSNLSPATSTLTDVVIVNSVFSNNGSNGIRTASHSVDGFTVTDTVIHDNTANGLAFNTSDNATVEIGGVTLTNVTFRGQGAVADLYAFRMLGSLSLTNVDFLGSRGSGLFGLYLLGGYVNQDSAPAIGSVTLDDVTVSGTYTSAGISFLGYSTLANVSLSDVVLDTAVPTANRGHLRLSGVAGTLDLGNTAFNATTSGFDVVMNNNFGASGSKSTVAVDATAATFSGRTGAQLTLPEQFAQQNRMIDVLDGTLTGADGLVTFVAGTLFVTAENGRLQVAVAAAAAGDIVRIAPGTYAENLSIGKQLSIVGAGSGDDPATSTVITAAAPNTPTVSVTAGGLDAASRLVIEGVRIMGATGSGNAGVGLYVSSASEIAHLTFADVVSAGNGAAGIRFNSTAPVADVVITGATFSDNGAAGIEISSSVPSFVGLAVTDTFVTRNGTFGFSYNPNGIMTNVGTDFTFTDVMFEENNTTDGTNLHDLSFFAFRGNATLTDVTVISANTKAYGIVFSNRNTAAALGTVTLSDVSLSGMVGKGGLTFQYYDDLSGVTLANVDVSGVTAPWGQFILFTQGAEAFDLGTTTLETLVLWSTGNVVATSAIFKDATSGNPLDRAVLGDNFTIADQVVDAGDVTGLGRVSWNPGNVYVTPASFLPPSTTVADVQRAVAVAGEGDTVWVQAGAYAAGTAASTVDDLTVNVGSVTGFAGLLLGGGLAKGTLAGTGAVSLTGNGLANDLVGNDGPNVLLGEAGDDALTGSGGDDAIDGGTGLDTAVFSGDYADYTVTVTGAGPEAVITVVDDRPGSPDGTDTLVSIERLRFADRTVNPLGLTLAIASSTSSLKAGETAEISFLLSDASADFTADDVIVAGGALSGFAGSGIAYTATFTPTAGFTGTATVTVPAGSFTDDIGTPNDEAVLSPPIVVDTAVPALVIAASAATLGLGQSATLAFTLSKPAVGFEAEGVEVAGGTLSGFTMVTPTAYTAVFTPLADFAGAGTVTVPAGAFTDAAGNPNLAASLAPPLVIDTVQPTVAITSDRGTLAAGQTAVITFTLSEPAPGFIRRNVDVSGGTLSTLTAIDATSYVGIFTPTPGLRGEGMVTVAAGSFTGASGNPNLPGSLAAPLVIATQRPGVTIVADAATLLFGQTAGLAFVLDAPSNDFVAESVLVSGGTLTDFAGSESLYTATFVPAAAFRGAGMVQVPAAAFSDAFGNRSLAGGLTPAFSIDTLRPRVTVTSSRSALAAGTSATITFSLSQPSTTFSVADVVVTGGALRNFTGGGRQYTAMFVPQTNLVGTGTIDVPEAAFVAGGGNPNIAGGLTAPLTIDTSRPTVTITSDVSSLAIGERAVITLVTSRPTASFRLEQIVATGGTLSNFTGRGTSYTAVFTPRAGFAGKAAVSVPSGAFRSTAGNLNVAGVITAPITIDTVRPTVRISSSASSLRAGQTAAISFALGRPSTDFTAEDVTVRGGTLSDFSGSGNVYTALFTPRAGFTGSGVIEVAAGTFTSTAGNRNLAAGLAPTIAIDTVLPAVTIAAGRRNLGVGGSSRLTFTLDRPATTFRPGIIAVTGGTLSLFQGSGRSYTAVFTPLANFTGEGTVTVSAGSFRSSRGNANLFSALATPLVIDTVRPSITISSSRTELGPGETATITFLLGRPSADFTAADVTVRGGTLSGFTGTGSLYTATFIPRVGYRGQGTISVAAGRFTGPTGSPSRAGSLATPIEIETLVQVAAAGLEATPTGRRSLLRWFR